MTDAPETSYAGLQTACWRVLVCLYFSIGWLGLCLETVGKCHGCWIALSRPIPIPYYGGWTRLDHGRGSSDVKLLHHDIDRVVCAMF